MPLNLSNSQALGRTYAAARMMAGLDQVRRLPDEADEGCDTERSPVMFVVKAIAFRPCTKHESHAGSINPRSRSWQRDRSVFPGIRAHTNARGDRNSCNECRQSPANPDLLDPKKAGRLISVFKNAEGALF